MFFFFLFLLKNPAGKGEGEFKGRLHRIEDVKKRKFIAGCGDTRVAITKTGNA